MSFQAYLDNIEDKTGTDAAAVHRTRGRRRASAPGTKAGEIVAWLGEDYGLGRGHAMALVHVITKGAEDRRQARRLRRGAQRCIRHALARRQGDESGGLTPRGAIDGGRRAADNSSRDE